MDRWVHMLGWACKGSASGYLLLLTAGAPKGFGARALVPSACMQGPGGVITCSQAADRPQTPLDWLAVQQVCMYVLW